MGGRGSSSGGGGGAGGVVVGPPVDPYLAILAKIKLTEGDPGLRALAQQLIDANGSETPNLIQQHDMSAPEPMRSVMVAGVKVNFATVDNRTLDAVANIAALFPSIVDTLDRWTGEVTLATKPAAHDPAGVATSGVGDARIVSYGTFDLDKVTLAHEITHNFVSAVLTGYDGLGGSLYQDVVESEFPSPYPQGNGRLEEDFAESTALYLLDPADFRRTWPKRAGLIERMITWEPED
jgi:hypothetical protein